MNKEKNELPYWINIERWILEGESKIIRIRKRNLRKRVRLKKEDRGLTVLAIFWKA